MTMVLVPLDGGRPVALDKAIVFFGRGAECDIVLNGSRKVSRKHCCIAQIDDYFIIRDLGSMNGLRVNAQPVSGEMQLKTGDEVWVGDLGFRFDSLGNRNSNDDPGQTRSLPPGQHNPGVDLVSQEVPVAIPDEEGVEFDVDDTRRHAIPQDEVAEAPESDESSHEQ